jgi:hypothetical protein
VTATLLNQAGNSRDRGATLARPRSVDSTCTNPVSPDLSPLPRIPSSTTETWKTPAQRGRRQVPAALRARVTATIYPGSRHGAARVQDRRIGARSKETA